MCGIAVDIFGPFSMNATGNKYLIVVMNCLEDQVRYNQIKAAPSNQITGWGLRLCQDKKKTEATSFG